MDEKIVERLNPKNTFNMGETYGYQNLSTEIKNTWMC